MGAQKQESGWGDFTIFGLTQDPEGALGDRLSSRLDITPRFIPFGNGGTLFFHTTYGDVAESETAIALKLGFIRSPSGDPLSAQCLLSQDVVKPDAIASDAFHGNALVAGFSKVKPSFAVFKTRLAVPQLYYAVSKIGILCSDRLRCLLALLDHVDLNEAILPMHFLFRSTPGEFTYFQGVERLLPGHLLTWKNETLTIQQRQDLRFEEETFRFKHDDARARELLYESLERVISDYITQITSSGQEMANLLSGGVDSSLMQSVINQHAPVRPVRSFSFAPHVPSFKFEVAYAEQASKFFETAHTFVEFAPEDYVGLLTRTIDILGQPPVLATEPSILSVAEFVDQMDIPVRFFFSGQAADALFGLSIARKLKVLHYVERVPAAPAILKGLGTLCRPLKTPSRVLLKGAEILACSRDPSAFASPVNTIAVYADWDLMRRCFGDRALREALEYRRELAFSFIKRDHYLEKVLTTDLLTDAYEVALQRHQLFLAHRREQPHPFLDEDMLRIGFSFDPDVRYVKGLHNKHLLKQLLYDKTGYPAAWNTKGFSVFEEDWYAWMHSGPLRSLIEDIQLPAFLNRSDLERMRQHPDYFLWELLILDLVKKADFG